MRWVVFLVSQYCRVSPAWLEPANGSFPGTSQTGKVFFLLDTWNLFSPSLIDLVYIFRNMFGFGAERRWQQAGGALWTTCSTWIQRLLPVRPLQGTTSQYRLPVWLQSEYIDLRVYLYRCVGLIIRCTVSTRLFWQVALQGALGGAD